ncbi:CpaF family protein [Fastidiosipila sanguinis]|uniref:Bacterial type II secretion system protein E domain-containing protein n=1 Tax=Fastidiosipila sanguinis TaxID=236753 RepID=A0A2S0KNP5_9FIRM|nr:ATPase, T2SS/T4P/T4SS family [Fastidiosipila sanguinis]AVM42638.1 hypothetical protein C5Q98_05165 [Fastidiosipila sanguinis]
MLRFSNKENYKHKSLNKTNENSENIFKQNYDYNKIYQEISSKVYSDAINSPNLNDQKLNELIIWNINRYSVKSRLAINDIEKLRKDIFNKLRRLDILQPLLDDPNITEIMVNGPDKIFYEKSGKLFSSNLSFNSLEELESIIISFFSKHNIHLSFSKPTANLRLPDGSRAHAAIRPVAPEGPILTIRKFTGIKPQMSDLIAEDFLNQDIANFLEEAILNKKSIMIGGGTGSGKTTLLNTLSKFIPSNERIVTIEDSPELKLQDKENWVKLITHEDYLYPENSVNLDDLIKESLRMRPDRIVIGEVRGADAYSMLKATQTGHPGTMCTIHANNCMGMVYRLADLILDASSLPYESILRHIYSAFDFLIHIQRNSAGKRYISEISELQLDTNGYLKINEIFKRGK